MFSVAGGNPVPISPMTNRTVSLTCPPRGTAAMRRCLYHATTNGIGYQTFAISTGTPTRASMVLNSAGIFAVPPER